MHDAAHVEPEEAFAARRLDREAAALPAHLEHLEHREERHLLEIAAQRLAPPPLAPPPGQNETTVLDSTDGGDGRARLDAAEEDLEAADADLVARAQRGLAGHALAVQ